MSKNIFYSSQTILLTGATGSLGGCVLFKLATVLQARRIFVLVRDEVASAISKWRTSMPQQLEEMLISGCITFIIGDMKLPDFGLDATTLEDLRAEVTIVIHAAANISLKSSLRQAMLENVVPALELGRMAGHFPNLISFVQISSAYACSFLPDGPVQETLFPIQDPSGILQAILEGSNDDWGGYSWPYARSKHLMEVLLSSTFPKLPLLIVRPTSIGPAIDQPFQLYGPPGSIPLDTFFAGLFSLPGQTAVLPAANRSATGANIVDEIPVDLVANILLQHIQLGTRGVVHACSRDYVPKTMNQLIEELYDGTPRLYQKDLVKVKFTQNTTKELSRIAKLYCMSHRDWDFKNDKNKDLEGSGPLGMDLGHHDAVGFARRRIRKIWLSISHHEKGLPSRL
ncbi:male sterility protein [Truncatella angustata]|uniref:Fatty acyl-CoA reductase n=1 Tax=Truncatella angustata TaxID=152316 RepID=A0A9P8RLT7_9PEZI|nr:male sterility protein [Truncatella angustata]KAH6645705.1 male sterility protein [Truncatella angustata]KAH8194333.1 hypothetical protein TruAng_011509 [Truncatella angustata]